VSESGSPLSLRELRRLTEQLRELSEDERALLLALAELDQETGTSLSPEMQELLQALAASLKSYDPEEIRAAIRRVVRSPSRQTSGSWPGKLRRRMRQHLQGR